MRDITHPLSTLPRRSPTDEVYYRALVMDIDGVRLFVLPEHDARVTVPPTFEPRGLKTRGVA